MSDNLLPGAGARLRSGTAARLAGVPVTTLRVWERRYGVVAGVKTPTGQRLYSPHDVLRLKLLRQLTHSGHAIGTIATLELHALQALADTEAGTGTTSPQAPLQRAAAPSRVVVVGHAAAHRVSALAGCVLLASHADLTEAQREAQRDPQTALSSSSPSSSSPPAHTVDVLLVQLASLQPAKVDAVLALADTLGAATTVVLYTFGGHASVQALRAEGVRVQREPVAGAALAQWLQPGRRDAPPRRAHAEPGDATGRAAASLGLGPIEARRFTDSELGELTEHASANVSDDGDADADAEAEPGADRSAVVHCECLRHLAEIVVQLAAFEHYSADCASTSVADAALHRHLHAITGAARTRFEQALQRVAAVEGVTLAGRPAIQPVP